MFVWKEKLAVRDEMRKIISLESDRLGSNRRAVALVPFPTDPIGREVVESVNFRYQKVLIALEGKSSTCCLKVTSPRRKSRAAVLVFRGRALGCIYGRKDLQNQLMGEEGYRRFVADLTDPESIVDTYILPEQLALAAGSLFHGSVFNQPPAMSSIQTFEQVHNHLRDTEMPGCIVARRLGTDDVLCFIYMFGGKIVGVFTFTEGWLDATYECAEELFVSQAISVSASRLEATNIDQVRAMSFSLAGLS